MTQPTEIVRLPGTYSPGDNIKGPHSMCVYGRGGSGKTTLLGTMPGRGLVIDIPMVEGGTFVLNQHRDRIEVVPITDWDKGPDNIGVDALYWFIKNQKHGYQWIGIDSITGLTRLAIRKVTGDRSLEVNPHKITQPEWGIIGNMVGNLVFQFRGIGVHVIWIAQERGFGQEGEIKVVGPDTSPAARQLLLPPLLMCARLYTETVVGGSERRLRVGRHPNFDTKIRAIGGVDMPEVIVNPHLGQIIGYALTGRGERPQAAAALSGILIG